MLYAWRYHWPEHMEWLNVHAHIYEDTYTQNKTTQKLGGGKSKKERGGGREERNKRGKAKRKRGNQETKERGVEIAKEKGGEGWV